MKYWINTNWGKLSVTDPSAFRVLNAFGQQTGKYNPATCRNGGGYWQMQGSCFVRSGDQVFFIETNDDSCGDFFTDQSVRIYPMDDSLDYPGYNFNWDDSGEVIDDVGVVDYWWFAFNVDLVDVVAAALRSTYDAAFDEWWEENN